MHCLQHMLMKSQVVAKHHQVQSYSQLQGKVHECWAQIEVAHDWPSDKAPLRP